MSDDETEDTSSDVSTLLTNLQCRATTLITQLQQYQELLQHHNLEKEVEIRTFKRGIESELKSLRLASSVIPSSKKNTPPSQSSQGSNHESSQIEPSEVKSKHIHALRSSNLPFYEAIWNVALRSKRVLALGKRVHCPLQHDTGREGSRSLIVGQRRPKKRSALVDVVAEDGLEWIKVSTITDKRLLLEIAKEGWEGYGDRISDDEEDGTTFTGRDDLPHDAAGDGKVVDTAELDLVKSARLLYAASRETRVLFTRPHVRFVLSNIHEGFYDDVDAVMKDIRAIGVEVTCSSHHDMNTTSDLIPQLSNLALDPAPNPDFIPLLPSHSFFNPQPTSTLNIDCTILLSLISDISHIPSSAIPPYPKHQTSATYHKAITRQIDVESNSPSGPLLPGELYPYLQGRRLVCTTQAATRMREIVNTMATEGERIRADIFMGNGEYHNCTNSELLNALTKQTCHNVPTNLKLPIEVIDFNLNTDVDTKVDHSPNPLPNFSPRSKQHIHQLKQKMKLSSINESVFLYGWHEDIVTVTSNRVMATGLVKSLNEILDEEEQPIFGQSTTEQEEFHAPKIYVCETARSLIGKEKRGGGTSRRE